MASCTFFLVLSEIYPLLFRTLETVLTETPAFLATSLIVTIYNPLLLIFIKEDYNHPVNLVVPKFF